VLVRYADDLLVFCRTRQHAEQVKQQLAKWLRPRGLGFNQAKTQIVNLNQWCDFLGFNIRRYHGRLALIKPSDHAVRRIRERLRTEMRALVGSNAAAVLGTLTPMLACPAHSGCTFVSDLGRRQNPILAVLKPAVDSEVSSRGRAIRGNVDVRGRRASPAE
jgi:hypothetical protein